MSLATSVCFGILITLWQLFPYDVDPLVRCYGIEDFFFFFCLGVGILQAPKYWCRLEFLEQERHTHLIPKISLFL